jgi:hypothetical protein
MKKFTKRVKLKRKTYEDGSVALREINVKSENLNYEEVIHTGTRMIPKNGGEVTAVIRNFKTKNVTTTLTHNDEEGEYRHGRRGSTFCEHGIAKTLGLSRDDLPHTLFVTIEK